MEAISVKVDYVPQNLTQFIDNFEMLMEDELTEGLMVEDVTASFVDPTVVPAAPQAAPVSRRRLRQLASDITEPLGTVPFVDAYATSYTYQAAAPLGPTAAPAAAAAVISGIPLNSTDIFMMPMASTSWASANVTESPCKMNMNDELPPSFLTVRGQPGLVVRCIMLWSHRSRVLPASF